MDARRRRLRRAGAAHRDRELLKTKLLQDARCLLELLLEQNEPALALKEFETSLGEARNRLRGFYGAAKAAEKAGDRRKAAAFYEKILTLTKNADSDRPEIKQAKAFLAAR